MDLAPKTTEDLEKLVRELRRMGVQQYSAMGVTLSLCEPELEIEKVKPANPLRSQMLGLTEEEQVDLFNTVAEAVPREPK